MENQVNTILASSEVQAQNSKRNFERIARIAYLIAAALFIMRCC